MPDVEAIIQHGPFPDNAEIIDEPNLLVQDVVYTPRRDKKTYKGGNQCTQALRYVDPTMSVAIKAIISEFSGLADQHPGTLVTDLLNFATPIHQFDPSQGILVYEDPVRNLGTDNPAEVNFNVMHYPFVQEAD